MQNHLLQVLALFAMEQPVSMDAEDIRNEKVKLLRSIRPIDIEDVVIGQYKGREADGAPEAAGCAGCAVPTHSPRLPSAGKKYPSYLDDKTVPPGSLCPTFAAIAFHIDNSRWDGVPFLMKAGKALEKRYAEIRIQYRHVPGNLYKAQGSSDQLTNELVIRIQPDEAIYLKINNKVPGLGLRLDRSNLDLQYKARRERAASAPMRHAADACFRRRRATPRSCRTRTSVSSSTSSTCVRAGGLCLACADAAWRAGRQAAVHPQ